MNKIGITLAIKHWLKEPKHKYALIIIIAAIVVILDTALLVRYVQDEHKQQAIIDAQTSALGTNNVPSSIKPTTQAVASYQVAPNLPKYLVIPILNIKARITKISTNPQNQIQAPSNIYDTAWYTSSSLPGQPGAMFIDGHVSSWTANGVFYDLKKLKPGDVIQIIRGDNKSFTYVVKQLQTYSANNVNMAQVLAPVVPGAAALNLMTCTGSVISGTSEFNERLVVYSVLQS